MLNNAVSIGNMAASRMLTGVLALSLDHPLMLCAILAGLAGASGAVLVDAVAKRP